MRRLVTSTILLLSLLLGAAAAAGAEEIATTGDSTVTAEDSSATAMADTEPVTYIAYYFHGTQRCATCLKLEAYSQEALETGFEKELADSSLIWRVVNYDEKDNKHYIDDYKLFTKAVILSRVENGREVGWTNLDKIWQLVNSKDDFIAYIQAETRAFIAGEDEETETQKDE
jgi:hypothetical protein